MSEQEFKDAITNLSPADRKKLLRLYMKQTSKLVPALRKLASVTADSKNLVVKLSELLQTV